MSALEHQVDLSACTLTFLEDQVVHAHFKDGLQVGPEDVQCMFDAAERRLQGRKMLLMVTVGVGSSLTNEARVHAASEASNRLIAADAIVVRDLGHQFAANVFVRHHRPGRPIRMFPDRESALEWLLQQRHLLETP